jgi:hypothetical protein
MQNVQGTQNVELVKEKEKKEETPPTHSIWEEWEGSAIILPTTPHSHSHNINYYCHL